MTCSARRASSSGPSSRTWRIDPAAAAPAIALVTIDEATTSTPSNPRAGRTGSDRGLAAAVPRGHDPRPAVLVLHRGPECPSNDLDLEIEGQDAMPKDAHVHASCMTDRRRRTCDLPLRKLRACPHDRPRGELRQAPQPRRTPAAFIPTNRQPTVPA